MLQRFAFIARYSRTHFALWSLLGIALASRLPLLSLSLGEVDSGNFYNAIKYGYDITNFRPHAPGYPLYVFIGWSLNAVIKDPLLSLTLLSALTGSLIVIPFYFLLRDLTGRRLAFFGGLLFMVNPLQWSFSEAALADVPSAFFVMLAAWLTYRGRRSNSAFLTSCLVMSLAVGVRQANVCLILLLAFPVVYRYLTIKEIPIRLVASGAALFFIVSALWFLPAVFIGTGGFAEYFWAVQNQWSNAVTASDISNLKSPWFLNLFYRLERFFLGYQLLYSWTGSDTKTAGSLLLATPWLFGFALFIAGFRARNPGHVFLALWLFTLLYPVLSIHFLPRYGLAHIPPFVIACLLGYHYLFSRLRFHPRKFEVLSIGGLGTVFLLYAVKHQLPVNSFEVNPPSIEWYVGVLVVLAGLAFFIGQRRAVGYQSRYVERCGAEGWFSTSPVVSTCPGLLAIFLALLVIPFGLLGYDLASIAHRSVSPSQRLVTMVETTYDPSKITVCWDNQTHSLFEASESNIVPVGLREIGELYEASEAGQALLVSDRCQWFEDLDDNIGLTEIAHFEGVSPLWSKAPSIRLYITSTLDSTYGK